MADLLTRPAVPTTQRSDAPAGRRRRSARRTIPSGLLVLAVAGAPVAGAAVVLDPVLGIALLVGLVYALAVVERPVVGVYVCFALVPLTAGLRRGLPIPEANLAEALTLGTFVLVAAFAGGNHRWGLLDVTVAAFALAAFTVPIGSAVLLDTPLVREGIQKMAAAAFFIPLLRLPRLVDLSDAQRWLALKLLFGGATVTVAVAFGQRFNLPGVRDMVASLTGGELFEGWSYQQGGAGDRATGLFPNWHSLAGVLFPLFLVAVALSTERVLSMRRQRVAVVMASVIIMGIVAAQTLTTLAVAVVAAICVGALQGRFLRAVTTIVLVGALAVAASGGAVVDRVSGQFEDTSLGRNVEDRIDIWTQDYAGALGSYWSTGYGPQLPPEIEWRHTESLYVTLLLRGGVPLLVLYLVLMLVVARCAWEGRRSDEPLARGIATGVLAAACGSVFINFVFPYLTASGFPEMLWLLAGLIPVAGAPRTDWRSALLR